MHPANIQSQIFLGFRETKLKWKTREMVNPQTYISCEWNLRSA